MRNLDEKTFDQSKQALAKAIAASLKISPDRIELSLDSSVVKAVETSEAAVLLEVDQVSLIVTIKEPASGSGEDSAGQAENKLEAMGTSKLTPEIQKVVPGVEAVSLKPLDKTPGPVSVAQTAGSGATTHSPSSAYMSLPSFSTMLVLALLASMMS
jgi:hypothetical protein